MVSGHTHLDKVAEAVEAGVRTAGGTLSSLIQLLFATA
ncbi:MAG: hypothetical protein QXP16_07095 [Candidatus Bathyarchaeia archaeon]